VVEVTILKIPAGSSEGPAVRPVGEGALVPGIPPRDLREWPFGNADAFERKVITVPDVEEKRDKRALVSAQRLLEKSDRVFWSVILGETLPSHEQFGDVETSGQEAPGLGWRHLEASFLDELRRNDVKSSLKGHFSKTNIIYFKRA
jgi:hypothetical protein